LKPVAIAVESKPHYNHWIGRRLIRGSEIPQENCVLESSLPSLYRIIEPGQFLTMDLVEIRLNVEIDENEIITKIWYG